VSERQLQGKKSSKRKNFTAEALMQAQHHRMAQELEANHKLSQETEENIELMNRIRSYQFGVCESHLLQPPPTNHHNSLQDIAAAKLLKGEQYIRQADNSFKDSKKQTLLAEKLQQEALVKQTSAMQWAKTLSIACDMMQNYKEDHQNMQQQALTLPEIPKNPSNAEAKAEEAAKQILDSIVNETTTNPATSFLLAPNQTPPAVKPIPKKRGRKPKTAAKVVTQPEQAEPSFIQTAMTRSRVGRAIKPKKY
jgi:hypothetical protein